MDGGRYWSLTHLSSAQVQLYTEHSDDDSTFTRSPEYRYTWNTVSEETQSKQTFKLILNTWVFKTFTYGSVDLWCSDKSPTCWTWTCCQWCQHMMLRFSDGFTGIELYKINSLRKKCHWMIEHLCLQLISIWAETGCHSVCKVNSEQTQMHLICVSAARGLNIIRDEWMRKLKVWFSQFVSSLFTHTAEKCRTGVDIYALLLCDISVTRMSVRSDTPPKLYV